MAANPGSFCSVRTFLSPLTNIRTLGSHFGVQHVWCVFCKRIEKVLWASYALESICILWSTWENLMIFITKAVRFEQPSPVCFFLGLSTMALAIAVADGLLLQLVAYCYLLPLIHTHAHTLSIVPFRAIVSKMNCCYQERFPTHSVYAGITLCVLCALAYIRMCNAIIFSVISFCSLFCWTICVVCLFDKFIFFVQCVWNDCFYQGVSLFGCATTTTTARREKWKFLAYGMHRNRPRMKCVQSSSSM